jgi:hypothetical protein
MRPRPHSKPIRAPFIFATTKVAITGDRFGGLMQKGAQQSRWNKDKLESGSLLVMEDSLRHTRSAGIIEKICRGDPISHIKQANDFPKQLRLFEKDADVVARTRNLAFQSRQKAKLAGE